MAKICMHARVTGKVQGVFFRASTREQALSMQISGFAKNLPDGSVEVLACGKTEEVESLLAWLHQGPPASRVDSVDTKEGEWQEITGFEVL